MSTLGTVVGGVVGGLLAILGTVVQTLFGAIRIPFQTETKPNSTRTFFMM